MGCLWSNVPFGVRMLVRHPTLSGASILTFGLGLGLATTVFSLVNGLLYKGLPFEEADRIVAVVVALAATGLSSGLIAARRVARLDPVVALGAE